MNIPKSFVLIKPANERGVEVTWGFTTLFKPGNDGVTPCYIPGYDIFFSITDKALVGKKSEAIMRMFFDHLFMHSGKNALGAVALQLHKLGFKTPNDAYTVKRLIKNERISAKFNAAEAKIPNDFIGSEKVSQEMEMQVDA